MKNIDTPLGQHLASVVRYVQDNSKEGTKWYFDEIPEDFFVPSVYFQIPSISGSKATLSSYKTTYVLNCWFMDLKDWDAYSRAENIRDSILIDNTVIPLVDMSGEYTGKGIRTGVPEIRKIDEGIVQLTISFDAYLTTRTKTEKMQKLYIAWNNAKKLVD